MREIKFRMWDGCGIMTEPMTLTDIVYEDNNARIDTQNENFIFLQYTGLKDKNGKESYNSDIIKTANENEELFQIEWFDDTASWVLIGLQTGKVRWIENREQFRSDFQINFTQCETIGNIYEHPDLLTNKSGAEK